MFPLKSDFTELPSPFFIISVDCLHLFTFYKISVLFHLLVPNLCMVFVSIYPNNLIKTIQGEWEIEWLSEQISGWLLFNVNPRTRYISMRWCWCQLYSYLDPYSASTQTQPSAVWNVAPFGHIILTPSQPLFSLTP